MNVAKLIPILSQTATIFVSMSLYNTCLASDVTVFAIKAPVACTYGTSCGHDIGFVEANKNWIAHKKRIEECNKRHDREDRDCEYQITMHTHDDYTCDYDDIWVDSRIAQDKFKEIREYAISGKIINNDDFFSYRFGAKLIIEVSGVITGERHLAVCSIDSIADIVGPPTYCDTIAIITDNLTLVRGQIEEPSTCMLQEAHVRPENGQIEIEYHVDTKLPLVKFSDSLTQMLQVDLDLAVEPTIEPTQDGGIYSVRLKSISPIRDSAILGGGWREALGFDLEISRGDGGIDVRGASQPMICRQASGNLVDYRVPDDSQRSKYASKLNSLVAVALKHVCTESTQIDSKRITCR